MRLRNLLVLLLCLTVTGCRFFPESMFDLADDSRLPKWLAIPEGRSRSDIRVEMYYYTDREVEFFLENKYGITLSTVKGQLPGKQPITMTGDPRDYPLYEFITIDGVSELIEHKKMEPIFYINDDPAVWKALGLPAQDSNS